MAKKRIDVSNRLSYTIIAVVALILLGAGVYAFGSTPNIGHSWSQMAGCDSAGQTLSWTGNAWSCVALSTYSGLKVYKSDGVTVLGDFVQANGDLNTCSSWVYFDASIHQNVQLTFNDCLTVPISDFYYVYNDCTFDAYHPFYPTVVASGSGGTGCYAMDINHKIYQTQCMSGVASLINGKQPAVGGPCLIVNGYNGNVYDPITINQVTLKCGGAPCVLK
jgi:hypothetical protein